MITFDENVAERDRVHFVCSLITFICLNSLFLQIVYIKKYFLKVT